MKPSPKRAIALAPEPGSLQNTVRVEPDGTIDLGQTYGGKYQVADLTTEDIGKKLTFEVRKSVRDVAISASLASSGRGVQQIAGQHLVRPTGGGRGWRYAA